MPFVIEKEPFKFHPSHAEILYKFYDTDFEVTDFYYVVKIAIGGELISTSELYGDEGGVIYFSPSTIINNYLTTKLENNITTIVDNDETLEYVISFYTNGVEDEEPQLRTSRTKSVWYSTQPYSNVIKTYDTLFDSFAPNILTPPKPLNVKLSHNATTLNEILSIKNTYKIRKYEQRTLTYVVKNSDNVGDITKLHIITKMKDGVNYKHFAIPISVLGTNFKTYFKTIPTGIIELSNLIDAENDPIIYLPPIPNIPSLSEAEDDYYYLFLGTSDAITPSTEVVAYKIDKCINDRYKKYSIIYHTQNGGINSIPFEMKSTTALNIKSEKISNIYRRIRNDEDRDIIKNRMVVNATYKLSNNWLTTQQEVDEIEEMTLSPKHLLTYEEGNEVIYIPVNLVDGKYNFTKIKQNKKLTSFSFDFSEAFTRPTLY